MWDGIGNYLAKYAKLAAPDKSVAKALQSAVAVCAGVELDLSTITIVGTEAYVYVASPVERVLLETKKDAVLAHCKKESKIDLRKITWRGAR